jgi:hypothetical protein
MRLPLKFALAGMIVTGAFSTRVEAQGFLDLRNDPNAVILRPPER